MNHPNTSLQALLREKFGSDAFDIVDLVQIPAKADRMVRMRTLEDALDDFDGHGPANETVGYLLQVRARRQNPSAESPGKPEGPTLTLESFQSPDALGNDRNLFARLTDETLSQARQDPGAVYVELGDTSGRQDDPGQRSIANSVMTAMDQA